MGHPSGCFCPSSSNETGGGDVGSGEAFYRKMALKPTSFGRGSRPVRLMLEPRNARQKSNRAGALFEGRAYRRPGRVVSEDSENLNAFTLGERSATPFLFYRPKGQQKTLKWRSKPFGS